MPLDLSTPTPLAYFAALVQSDAQLPLLEAVACLGQDEYPDLDLQRVLDEVDHMTERLKRRSSADASPMDRLRALNQFFFGELGFGGNVNDYYTPDNSYLHIVLRTRRGIPVSLAVLWLELAQGLGLAAAGVGFPGHFLVQADVGDGRVVVDPFTGQSLSRDDLRGRIEELYPNLAAAPGGDAPLALYLQPTAPRQILARMLRNLQEIHRSQAAWSRLVAVQDRLIVLLPRAWEAYRDRGLALAQLGQRERAQADLALYLREAGDVGDRASVADRLTELGRS